VSPVPAQPKIYHITHVDNVTAIVRDGVLLCDATLMRWYDGQIGKAAGGRLVFRTQGLITLSSAIVLISLI
jgi:hypothetical protein